MKKRHKLYLKLNIMSLVFIVVSFISVTLAWFAYSGIANVDMEIGVKAWYIELEKDGEAVSNNIVISLSDIYPGMDTVNELVNIKNLGDSDAEVKYNIVSARILGADKDNYVILPDGPDSLYVEDILSHNYPFHININLNKRYVLSKGEESTFEVSVSWPLDSADDALDSLWGTEAYKFQKGEEDKKNLDPNYQIKPSIQVVISVEAEQYLEMDESSDSKYNLGDEVLFDVVNNQRCTVVSDTCIKTYVMDVNNKLGDETVTLLPDPNGTYQNDIYNNYDSDFSLLTTNWTVNKRSLLVSDLLKIVSMDVMNSYLVRENISNSIIGNLNYNTRINTELTKTISYNGYYSFTNNKFSFLTSNNCYWINSEYNTTNSFSVKKIDEVNSKIYGEDKNANCNIIPVIIANKTNL